MFLINLRPQAMPEEGFFSFKPVCLVSANES